MPKKNMAVIWCGTGHYFIKIFLKSSYSVYNFNKKDEGVTIQEMLLYLQKLF